MLAMALPGSASPDGSAGSSENGGTTDGVIIGCDKPAAGHGDDDKSGRLCLRIEPATATSDTATSQTLIATLEDRRGRPVDGQIVRFEVFRALDDDAYVPVGITGSDRTHDGLDDDGEAADESSGEATFDYRGPDEVAEDLVVACLDRNGDGCASVDATGALTFDQREKALATASIVWGFGFALEPASGESQVGTFHSVTATVSAAGGEPASGLEVSFEVWRSMDGGVTFTLAETGTDLTGDGLDDDGRAVVEGTGEATYGYLGPSAPALDRIVACVQGGSDGCAFSLHGDVQPRPGETAFASVEKTWVPGPPASVELSPDLATNAAGETHTVVATVEDFFGNQLPAGTEVLVEVYRTADDTGSSGFSPIPVDGDLETTGDAGEGPGEASFTYQGPNEGAVDVIVACVDSGFGDWPHTCDTIVTPDGVLHVFRDDRTDSATKRWAVPKALTIIGPATHVQEVDQPRSVVAELTDQFGDPVAGEPVHIEVWRDIHPMGGGFLRLAGTGHSGVTDADGRVTLAYSTITAGIDAIVTCLDEDEDGRCATSVTAADTGTGVVTFIPDPDDAIGVTATSTMVWEPGPPSMLVSLTSVTDTDTVGTDHTVVVRLEDAFGNAVVGEPIHIEVWRDAIGPPSIFVEQDDDTFDGVTNIAGVATHTYSTTVAGEDAIVACWNVETVVGCTDGPGVTDVDTGTGAVSFTPDSLDVPAVSVTLTKKWEPDVVASLVLTPDDDTNRAGVDTEHTVVATVFDQFGNQVKMGTDVRFDVYRADTDTGDPPFALQTDESSGTEETGDDPSEPGTGVASYTYSPDPPLAAGALDKIVACATTDATPATSAPPACASLDGGGDVVVDGGVVADPTPSLNRWASPSSIALATTSSSSPASGGTVSFTAQVLDQFGNTMDGVLVTFEVFRDETTDGSFDSSVLTATDVTADGLDDDGDSAAEGSGIATFDYGGGDSGPAGAQDVILACWDGPDGDTTCGSLNAGAVDLDADDPVDAVVLDWT